MFGKCLFKSDPSCPVPWTQGGGKCGETVVAPADAAPVLGTHQLRTTAQISNSVNGAPISQDPPCAIIVGRTRGQPADNADITNWPSVTRNKPEIASPCHLPVTERLDLLELAAMSTDIPSRDTNKSLVARFLSAIVSTITGRNNIHPNHA
jgi:hypothetical protein